MKRALNVPLKGTWLLAAGSGREQPVISPLRSPVTADQRTEHCFILIAKHREWQAKRYGDLVRYFDRSCLVLGKGID